MPKKVIKGVGMRAVEVPDPTERPAVLAAWDAFDASVPVKKPGEVGGDALRRVNAERMVNLLRDAGLPDDAVELRRELAARGFTEDTAQHLASDWLRAWRRWSHARARLLEGDVSAETVAALSDAAQAMGELEERMWWRCGVDSTTGERREALALRGRNFTGPNRGIQAKTTARAAFLRRIADDFQTSNRDALARHAIEDHWREVRRLWDGAERGTVETKILTFLRNNAQLVFEK